MFNVNRREIASLTLMALLLIEWQLYSNNIKLGISHTDFVEREKYEILSNQQALQQNLNDASLIHNSVESIISEPTTFIVDNWTGTSVNDQQLTIKDSNPQQQPELYRVIENYSKDHLLERPFKRILFWNKVRHIYACISSFFVYQFVAEFSFKATQIMASGMAVMPCRNRAAPFGNVRRQITEPTPTNTTPSSFIFVPGRTMTYQNVDHLTSATFSLIWNQLRGTQTVSLPCQISSTGP